MEAAPSEWFPPLEQNQGTITLLALIFAIGWGLYEQHRANHAEERRQRFAITHADQIVQRTFNLLLMWDQVGMPLAALQDRLILTADALLDYARSNASMPELAIAVLRASKMFRFAGQAKSPTDINERALPVVEAETQAIRAELAVILYQWDAEHRGPLGRTQAWIRHRRLRHWGNRPAKLHMANVTPDETVSPPIGKRASPDSLR